MCLTCIIPMPTVAPAVESTISAPATTNPSRMRPDARCAPSGAASIHNKASPPLGSKLPGLAPGHSASAAAVDSRGTAWAMAK